MSQRQAAPSTDVGRIWRIPVVRFISLFLVVAGAYALGAETAWGWFGAGNLGLAFFPSAGVTLAALLLVSRRMWPAVILAIIVAENLVGLRHGLPLADSAWYTLANVIEPIVGTSTVIALRKGHSPLDLRRRRDVLQFMLAALVVAPATAATVAATFRSALFDKDWTVSFTNWWIGDGLGMLCVGAPIIAIAAQRSAGIRRTIVDGIILSVASGAVALMVFRVWDLRALEFVVLPVLLIAAVRRNVFGLGVASLVTAVIANVSTAAGHGPFAALDVSPQAQLGFAQLFLAISTLTAWFFAVESNMRLAAQRDEADERQARLRAEALASTARLSTQLSAARDVDEVFASFTEHCESEFDASVVIARRREDVNGRGASPLHVQAPLWMSPTHLPEAVATGWRLADHRVIAQTPAHMDDSFPGLAPAGVVSASAFPIRTESGIVDCVVGWSVPHAFNDGEIVALQTAAEVFVQSLERSASYAEAHSMRAQAEHHALRLAELQRITVALNASATTTEIAQAITSEARTAVSAISCALTLLVDDRTSLHTVASSTPLSVESWRTVPIDVQSPSEYAIRTRTTVVLASSEDLIDRFPAARAIADHGDHAWVIAPVRMTDQAIGTLSFGFENPQPPPLADIAFVEAIADQCALALERVRQREAEHDAVLRLQRSLLPRAVASTKAVTVFASYRPAEVAIGVGGDWYDAVDLPNGQVMLIVGDVVGQGLGAAIAMGQMRSATRALAFRFGPGELLDAMDQFSQEIEGGHFTTIACVLIDPQSGELRYSVAGHPPPLVRGIDGSVRFLQDGRSTPVGISSGTRPEAREVFEAGDLVFLYTDGLVERRREVLDDGIERARSILAGADIARSDWCEQLIDACVSGVQQRDDVAVLAASLTPTAATLRIELDPAMLHVRGVRAKLRVWLTTAGVSEAELTDVVLAVGEAATNSLLYAGQVDDEPIVVEASIRNLDSLHLTVRDRGRWLERGVDNPSVGGRGLLIISQVVDDLSIDKAVTGTTVRMRRRLGTGSDPLIRHHLAATIEEQSAVSES